MIYVCVFNYLNVWLCDLFVLFLVVDLLVLLLLGCFALASIVSVFPCLHLMLVIWVYWLCFRSVYCSLVFDLWLVVAIICLLVCCLLSDWCIVYIDCLVFVCYNVVGLGCWLRGCLSAWVVFYCCFMLWLLFCLLNFFVFCLVNSVGVLYLLLNLFV